MIIFVAVDIGVVVMDSIILGGVSTTSVTMVRVLNTVGRGCGRNITNGSIQYNAV